MKDELIKNLKKIRIKWFSHNDLDGVSCAIIAKKLYNKENISFDFSFLDYNNLKEIGNFFDDYEKSRMYDFIFITDLNVKPNDYEIFIRRPLSDFINNKNSYENTNKLNLFKKLFFIDHHIDSEKTIRNIEKRIFNFIEYYNDTTYCASFQVLDWFINNRSSIWTENTLGCENKNYDMNKSWCRSFVDYVNDWDLFNWKKNGNIFARDLNLLFTHIKREKFILMQEQKVSPVFSFNKREKTIIKEVQESIEKEFNNARHHSIVKNHRELDIKHDENPNIQFLLIKSDENVSLICDMFKDMILSEKFDPHYKIEYIVNVSFKYGSVNIRRVNESIDCAKIANFYGGGGHPFAAGFSIDSHNQYIMEDFIMPILSVYKK